MLNKLNKQSQAKQEIADRAVNWLKKQQHNYKVIGFGSGSTVNMFIKSMATKFPHPQDINCVAASQTSANLLKELGFSVVNPNEVIKIDFYFDGADEINPQKEMIKGGGAALTGEKILAGMSQVFICIADQTKKVKRLGKFPLPIEVIEIARSYVAREMLKLGGNPEYRIGVKSDYGNMILDIHNLHIDVPLKWEEKINGIAGIVTNGLFALRPADLLISND